MPEEIYGNVQTSDWNMSFKKLSMNDGDILVIRNGDVPKEYQKAFVESLTSLSSHRFTVLFLDSLEDVKALSYDELEKIQEWNESE